MGRTEREMSFIYGTAIMCVLTVVLAFAAALLVLAIADVTVNRHDQ